MASKPSLKPLISDDPFARQAIEILLVAPSSAHQPVRIVRRLAIVGPAPSESAFGASLLFSRLSEHFQRQFAASLGRVAQAALFDLFKQAFSDAAPTPVVSGGSGAVLISFCSRGDDPASRADRADQEAIWRSRWDHAQSLIEKEAVPEWIHLRFLGNGARLVATRSERAPQVALSVDPSDFLANCVRSQVSEKERAALVRELSAPSDERSRSASSPEPRRL